LSISATNIANTYFEFINTSPNTHTIPNQPANNSPSNALSIFYINDIHAQLSNLSRLKTAGDTFTKVFENDLKNDTFKISAGDMNIGNDVKKNQFMVNFLNVLGIDYAAFGNHEFDNDTTNLSKAIDKANYKYIGTNVEISNKDPLAKNIQDGKIAKSWIEEQNNHKYGFIGLSPIDLKARLHPEVNTDEFDIKDYNNTVKEVQNEVNNLKKQGINRIILTSHLGYDTDVKLAQQVSGIDIIIGGHSHHLIQGLTPKINYLTSPEGEPVIITQAGRDGNFYGILNAIFDDKGRITKAQNTVHKTENIKKDNFVEFLKEKLLGKARPIGILSDITYPNNIVKEENPVACFIADSMRYKTGAQIAFVNSGGIRGTLKPGIITTRNIQDIIPFYNKLAKVELSEKDIIDTLNHAAMSSSKPPFKPGVMQVSGLKYIITPQKTVKDVFIENADGSLTKLDNITPSTSKKFTVVYDNFLLNAPEGLVNLKKKPIRIYDFDKTFTAIEYIEKFNNKPVEIKNQKRIIIE
jgi:5'-nucleotidase